MTRLLEPVCPSSHSDGHDPPRLIDELVPGVAAVVDDLVVGFEDAVREPIVADELPDVFLRVRGNAAQEARDETCGPQLADPQDAENIDCTGSDPATAGCSSRRPFADSVIFLGHKVGVSPRRGQARSAGLMG